MPDERLVDEETPIELEERPEPKAEKGAPKPDFDAQTEIGQPKISGPITAPPGKRIKYGMVQNIPAPEPFEAETPIERDKRIKSGG